MCQVCPQVADITRVAAADERMRAGTVPEAKPPWDDGEVDLMEGVLQEPFVLADLARKIRALLDHPHPNEQAAGAVAAGSSA